MSSLQVHDKARPQVSFGPAFCPWPTNSVYASYSGHWTLGLSLKDRSMSIFHFNLDLNPVCKTCSWSLFEVSKNNLKKCVLDIAALLQSQEKIGSASLGQSFPGHMLCACTLPDLRLSLGSGHLALLSPSCRLPVASLSLFRHFQPPVAPLSLACRFPVAVLPLPCRSPVASLSLSCRPPVAILSLPVVSSRGPNLLCWILLHSFLPCFSLLGNFTKIRSPSD